MRYSIEIRKFLYSQYFFGGLRTLIGVALPAVLFTVVFHNHEIGFTIATAALGVSVVDMPGPLKYKHNEMLACAVIGFLAALATGVATASAITLWLTIVPLTFVLSLTVLYGNKWPQISFATLFMMAVTVEQHFTPLEALINALWLLGGGLWYTYWSFFFSRWHAQRLERQAIVESIFATAVYLDARAVFFDINADLEESYRQLVTKQIAAIERQDAARDIVLRSLPHRVEASNNAPRKFRRALLSKLWPRPSTGSESQRATLYNLFMQTVDLHETTVAAHTDYALIRQTFGASDLMVFFGDLIRKTAHDLEGVGLALLQSEPPPPRPRVKAEMRAIEYEIEQMRKRQMQDTDPEPYAAIVATYRRIWRLQRQIDKICRDLREGKSKEEDPIAVADTLSRFLSPRSFAIGQIFSNLSMASPSFRHALRVTIAVAIGLLLGDWLPLTNAYWIVMTSVIILKPGFSLTRQRNTQRIAGTVIGCAATVALIVLVKTPAILMTIMFACMLMAYSLLLFNYTAAVVFTSSYVLLLYHLLAPDNMRLIGERAVDTMIGGAIAIAVSHLFPYWEYRLMRPLVKGMLTAMRQYLQTVKGVAPVLGNPAPAIPAMVMASAVEAGAGVPSGNPSPSGTGATTAGATARTGALERDFGYRLARKNVNIAFANLGQAFARMMREPKSQQKFVPELNDMLIQSHALASQITAAAPLLATLEGSAPDALYQALDAVNDNLQAAADDKGQAPDHVERSRELTRILDDMVVNAEQTASPETAHELKLLAHQCKQMLSASSLMCKDAAKIRLPD